MKSRIQLRAALVLASVLIVSACSAIKLGYNNSATFAHTYLSNKVDFDAAQSILLKKSLVDMVEWHRNKELPLLAQELQSVQLLLRPRNGVVVPVSTGQVQAWNQTVRTSLRRSADQAAPIVAKNMLGLWPNQVKNIQSALDNANEKYRKDRLADHTEQNKEKSADRMIERFENWLGDLHPTQKKRIVAWAETDTLRAESRYQKRLERQQQFMILVKQASNRQIDQTTLGLEISKLLNGWQTPANANERLDSEHRQKAAIALLVDVLNSATPEQRDNAAEQAASWARDFQILVSTR